MVATTAAGRADPSSQLVPSRAGPRHVLAFAGLSVGLAAAATLTGNAIPPSLVPFVLAFGPLAFALVFAWHEGDGALRRLLRMAWIRPARRGWYLVLALPVAWALGTVAIAVALGEPVAGLFDGLFPRVPFIALLVVLPAFGEEIAWRGWAVSRLMPSMSPLAAALLLGIPWGLLHLFLQLPGQMNEGLAAWPTMVSLLAYSVVLTWAWLGSGGSVLLTALLHAGFNAVAPLMANLDTDQAWIIRAVLAAAIAVTVIVMSPRMRRPPTTRGSGSPD